MKAVVTCLLTLVSLFASAQQTDQHLKFMGIPIDGNYRTFLSKVVMTKGYEIGGTEYNSAPNVVYYYVKKGSYAGQDVITIELAFSEVTNTVYNVGVTCKCSSEKEANWFFNFVCNTVKERYDVESTTEDKDYGNRVSFSLLPNKSGLFQNDGIVVWKRYAPAYDSWVVYVGYKDVTNFNLRLSEMGKATNKIKEDI